MGSLWWIDDDLDEYMRLPKHEGPRERAEWSDERAGSLEDGVWHPMTDWRIGWHPYRAGDWLIINRDESVTVWAPDAKVVS